MRHFAGAISPPSLRVAFLSYGSFYVWALCDLVSSFFDLVIFSYLKMATRVAYAIGRPSTNCERFKTIHCWVKSAHKDRQLKRCWLSTRWLQGVSIKSTPPPKTFCNIFTLVKSFCVKLCKFVGNLYLHISTNFCRFITLFHQMALIFPRVGYPSFSPCPVLSRPIHPENENAAFHKWRHFIVIACLCPIIVNNW